MTSSHHAFWEAVNLYVAYKKKPQKIDYLLSRVRAEISGNERRYCQFLFLGAVRHESWISYLIGLWVAKKPRAKLLAVLQLALFEVLEAADEKRPQVVHGAVEAAKSGLSQAEGKLVNAVLRRALKEDLEALLPDGALGLAIRYSHPEWLVCRWIEAWGEEKVLELLKWNQQSAAVYARSSEELEGTDFEATSWPGFYHWVGSDWRVAETLLDAGTIYMQDPSTAVGPRLLDVKDGASVLDLCSAPGGKLLQLAASAGLLVAVDRPGKRLVRLRENVERYDYPIHIVGADVMEMGADTLLDEGLPELYDAVFIDVPCSNTGVIQRRPDVKWRLEPSDMERLKEVQLGLLLQAARYVKPGGKLLYSTCSIEASENQDVIDAFLGETTGFELLTGSVHMPTVTGHDGCGAYLLKRA